MNDAKVRDLLDELHEKAGGDRDRWAGRRNADGTSASGGCEEPIVRLGEFYLAITRQEGGLLHLLARAARAKRIVEFGASFGISTLYLAAAAADNGGEVITTEVHPDKCAAARANLARAGLSEYATVIEGDARQTLADIAGPIDFVLLDGWKSMYLAVFELLRPKLSPGAVIAADNWRHDGVASYMAAVSDPASGFTTVTLDDMALSCLTG
ncbi:MAG: class I SAM-dependent methyltransferase [Rhizobiaceae bacterium]